MVDLNPSVPWLEREVVIVSETREELLQFVFVLQGGWNLLNEEDAASETPAGSISDSLRMAPNGSESSKGMFATREIITKVFHPATNCSPGGSETKSFFKGTGSVRPQSSDTRKSTTSRGSITSKTIRERNSLRTDSLRCVCSFRGFDSIRRGGMNFADDLAQNFAGGSKRTTNYKHFITSVMKCAGDKLIQKEDI
jgi:hypothetical protein